MAREFDIHLNKRLTECDIIVYSIPFRDGLTAVNRVILESCLEYYLLQKFVAAETGSELEAHIDDMILMCREKLNLGTQVGMEVGERPAYVIYPGKACIIPDAENIGHMARVFERAANAVQVGMAKICGRVMKDSGGGENDIILNALVDRSLKNNFVSLKPGIVLKAEVEELKNAILGRTDFDTQVSAQSFNLLHQVYTTAQMAIGITAQVADIEMRYSFGNGKNDIVTEFGVEDTRVQKFEMLTEIVNIVGEATEFLMQFMYPKEQAAIVKVEADMVLRKYRLLREMDNNPLSGYDSMTLDDVDFITL